MIRRTSADNTKEHEALLDACLLEASHRPGCEFSKVTNYSGRTDRGTFISAGVTVGCADLVGQVFGLRCDLEIKTGAAEQTIDQIAWQHRVRASGGTCEVVRSLVDMIRVVEELTRRAEAAFPENVAMVRGKHAEGRARLAKLEQALAAKRAAHKSRHASAREGRA